MKKLILLAVFFISIFYFTDISNFLNNTEDGDWDNKVSLGECEFRVEIVSDDDSRREGLSNRESLCEECGMLFTFPQKDTRFFWMKDMRFPLDIIWVQGNKVIGIDENVSQDLEGSLQSPGDTDKVLEINASKSNECNIKKDSILKYVD